MAIAALLAVAPLARADLPLSDPRVPWRIGPRSITAGRHHAALEGAGVLRSDFSGAARTCRVSEALPDLPVLSAGHPLLEALHRMALAQALASVRPDGLLMAATRSSCPPTPSPATSVDRPGLVRVRALTLRR